MADSATLPAPVKRAKKPTHHDTLSMALFVAQTEFGEIIADGLNAEKGYRWRTFKAIREALAPVLHKNGLLFMQSPDGVESHDGRPTFMLKTAIIHASTGAEFIGRYPVCDVRIDAHSKATCLTLARRYSLVAMMGVSAETEEEEPAHQPRNLDPEGIDQRPDDERPLLAGAGLGAIKDKLVEDWQERMRACTSEDDVAAILSEAEDYPHGRFSDNVMDGLRTIADEERERIKAGAAPREPAPSPFEELKAEGLACADVKDANEAIGAYARWLSRVNAKTKLAACAPAERDELKKLKKSVKSTIDAKLYSAALVPATAEEGEPVRDGDSTGGAGSPSTLQEQP